MRSKRHWPSLVVIAAAVGIAPVGCNVFVSLDRCNDDNPCPHGFTCDSAGRFCIENASGSPDGASPTDGSAVDVIDAGAGDADANADDGAPDTGPPACDPAVPFGAATLVPGLDPTVTTARFTQDELEILYSADPPPCVAESCADLFFRTRSSRTAAFEAEDPLPGSTVSVPNASDYYPTLTEDGLLLFFESSRSVLPLGDGGYTTDRPRIWTSVRGHKSDDFGAPHVQSIFQSMPGAQGSPFLHPNGQSVYFFSTGGPNEKGSLDLYVARLDPTVGFEAQSVTNVEAVNTTLPESSPVVTYDDRALYFAREDANNARHVYRSARSAPGGTFGAPAPVPEINSSDDATEEFPMWVSPDECRIYFVSNRSETSGGSPSSYRLWVAERPH